MRYITVCVVLFAIFIACAQSRGHGGGHGYGGKHYGGGHDKKYGGGKYGGGKHGGKYGGGKYGGGKKDQPAYSSPSDSGSSDDSSSSSGAKSKVKQISGADALKHFVGDWQGHGFNLVQLPDFENGNRFRVKASNTYETLSIDEIEGGPIPNRGSFTSAFSHDGQDDIFISGYDYLQQVFDRDSNEQLHYEPGVWIGVPATDVPNQNATAVRMGSIPHGDSLNAQSVTLIDVQGGPRISAVDSTPTGTFTNKFGFMDAYNNAELPDGVSFDDMKNPNQILLDAISGQNIIRTIVVSVSTDPSGGIINIPFVVKNANAVKLDAIFWIETVQNDDGSTFQQLQYTQTVVLRYMDIDFPHISVATLTLEPSKSG